MRFARLSIAALIAGLSFGWSASAASAAPPAPPPAVAFAIPASGDAGVPETFHYHATHLHKGYTLRLQRTVGTAHSWLTVARLKGTSGAGQTPALPLGAYAWRVIAVSPAGKAVTASPTRRVHVFGTVPIQVWCNNDQAVTLTYYGECGQQTVNIGTTALTSTIVLQATDQPNTAITASRSTCRSMSLEVGMNSSDTQDSPAATGTVTVDQEHADEVTQTYPVDTLAAITIPMAPGSWTLTYRGDYNSYLTGSLSCYTADAS